MFKRSKSDNSIVYSRKIDKLKVDYINIARDLHQDIGLKIPKHVFVQTCAALDLTRYAIENKTSERYTSEYCARSLGESIFDQLYKQIN